MKYSITIASDDASQLANALLTIAGAATLASSAITLNAAAAPEDDDDTGPVAAIQPGEVDATGLPWDERIHAKTKTKNADGRWKRKVRVTDDLVTAVEGELRARQSVATAPGVAAPAPALAPAPAAPAVPPPAPAPAPVAAPHDPMAAALADGWIAHPSAPGYHYKGQEVVADGELAAKYPAPAVAAAPAAPAVPAPAATGGTTFHDLMQAISNAVAANKIDTDGKNVAEISAHLGVGQITEVAADPAKIAQAFAFMQSRGWL